MTGPLSYFRDEMLHHKVEQFILVTSLMVISCTHSAAPLSLTNKGHSCDAALRSGMARLSRDNTLRECDKQRRKSAIGRLSQREPPRGISHSFYLSSIYSSSVSVTQALLVSHIVHIT